MYLKQNWQSINSTIIVLLRLVNGASTLLMLSYYNFRLSSNIYSNSFLRCRVQTHFTQMNFSSCSGTEDKIQFTRDREYPGSEKQLYQLHHACLTPYNKKYA